ncbi:MAG: methyltransferase domain-containing protein [Anaerolineae bacterium]|nr:methyltransferase domain-containing protein [Anaerolineae bacterium]
MSPTHWHQPSVYSAAMKDFEFACPRCRGALTAVSPAAYHCAADGLTFTCEAGIWRFLLPERAAHFAQFMQEYETVRQAEGWGGPTADYYRALPVVTTGDHREIWHIRARSYQALQAQVVEPMVKARARPLRILDIGAGNGWLAYRLAQAGHQVAAVDLLTNTTDGLGARLFYEVAFTAVQAEFDHLPFAPAQADLLIFNGAFHYAARYEVSLQEGLRVLRADGRVIIMDSPVYRDGGSGRQMVQERQQQFQEAYGFGGNALPHENYLTFERLVQLAESVGMQWHMIRPAYGWRWALRPWLARLRRRREPATFLLIVGQTQNDEI